MLEIIMSLAVIAVVAAAIATMLYRRAADAALADAAACGQAMIARGALLDDARSSLAATRQQLQVEVARRVEAADLASRAAAKSGSALAAEREAREAAEKRAEKAEAERDAMRAAQAEAERERDEAREDAEAATEALVAAEARIRDAAATEAALEQVQRDAERAEARAAEAERERDEALSDLRAALESLRIVSDERDTARLMRDEAQAAALDADEEAQSARRLVQEGAAELERAEARIADLERDEARVADLERDASILRISHAESTAAAQVRAKKLAALARECIEVGVDAVAQVAAFDGSHVELYRALLDRAQRAIDADSAAEAARLGTTTTTEEV
jgi:chromosome segregation ATPase